MNDADADAARGTLWGLIRPMSGNNAVNPAAKP